MRAIGGLLLAVSIAGMWLLAGAPAAGAHPLGLPAFARISAHDDATATVVWNAAPDDVAALARRLGVAVEEGAVLTEQQDAAFSQSEALQRALREGIVMHQDGRRCDATVQVTSLVRDGATVGFACPRAPGEVVVRITLLTDIDQRYRTLAVAGTAQGTQRFMFTDTAPEHRMVLDPAAAGRVVAAGTTAGETAGGRGPFGGSLPFESQFVALIDRRGGLAASLIGLLVALGVGAAHALAPGHGKAIAAAYLVGDRGRPRDAILLGLAVAVMHTWSVLALGFALYSATRRPATEALSGWLQLVSGIAVTGVGVWLVVRRLRDRRTAARHHEPATQAHPLSWQGLVALGAAGGLLPSPSALLVLFTALAVGRVGYGLTLIGLFSVGLAATVSVIGLAVVRGRDLLAARSADAGERFHRLLHSAPLIGAAAVVALGLVLVSRAAVVVVAVVGP